jgi:hypothetical protein
MDINGFAGISGAGRVKPARGGKKRRKKLPVEVYENDC